MRAPGLGSGILSDVRGEDGAKLYYGRRVGKRLPGGLTEKAGITCPYGCDQPPDVAFHGFSIGVLMPGCLGIQPFRHQRGVCGCPTARRTA